MHMVTDGYSSTQKLLDYYSNSSFDKRGGGLFGGIIIFSVGKVFGRWGCVLVSLFGMIITLCIATQKPLVSQAAQKGMQTKDFISTMKEKSIKKKKKYLPLDDEFGYDIEDDIYPDYEDEEDEEEIPKVSRRSAKKETSIRKRELFRKPDLFSFDLDDDFDDGSDEEDSKPETKPNLKKDEPAAKQSQKIKETHEFFIQEEFDFSVPDQEPELTINKSEGAAALEVQKTYNPYEDLPSAQEEETEGKKQKKKNARSSEEEINMGIESISEEIEVREQKIQEKPYQLPPLDLLKKGTGISRGDSTKYLKETAGTLEQVLRDFGVNVQVTDVSCGPSVTRFELKPEQGVKVSRIVNLQDDIKLNLAASNIRIEAPIPGKAAVGIEVPNKTVTPVLLRDMLESQEFKTHPSKIAFAVGKDIAGKTVVTDIARMPHLLIAGATGSGKSVCINTLIMSILYKASPDEVKLLMIDPKVVELSVYNGIPHLAIPVVTDPKKAAGALNWAVAEMSDRYNKFAEYGVRDVAGYNARVTALGDDVPEEQKPKKMPQIVIVVDELADLMMVAPGEVEDAICRLAQLARAAGIHLIIATQRPSVNVVTGLIKANMPSRIALSVASGVDSRTILDMNGAEKLLGHGDMLFYPQGYTKPARVQGGYVSDEEIGEVVKYLTEAHGEVTYDASIEAKINSSSSGAAAAKGGGSDQDDLFIDAAKIIIDKDKASIGMLQRQFKIGFNRAARIMDQLCDAGVVGAEEGTKPRKVLMSKEQFENYLEDGRL